MTVAEMLSRISSVELTEWIAFNAIEPIGEHRADLRAGIVASVVANANRDPKKHPQPFDPLEFAPLIPRSSDETNDDALAAKIAAALGGL